MIVKYSLNDLFWDQLDMLTALDESTLITITDGDGTLLYVNKLFCEISEIIEISKHQIQFF